VHLQLQIIGVADTKKDALGRRFAEQLNIPTTSDYREFLHNKELDLIIELTGDDTVLGDIRHHKLESIKLIDHVARSFSGKLLPFRKKNSTWKRRYPISIPWRQSGRYPIASPMNCVIL
jgi:hypothetical protein